MRQEVLPLKEGNANHTRAHTRATFRHVDATLARGHEHLSYVSPYVAALEKLERPTLLYYAATLLK